VCVPNVTSFFSLSLPLCVDGGAIEMCVGNECANIEAMLGTLHGEALYQLLWERLKDTYRLAQASFASNLFDHIRYRTLLVRNISLPHLSQLELL
jgi:hypothetical protein